MNFRFVGSLFGPSWVRLGALLGRIGRLLGRLGAFFGRLGGLLGRLGAMFEASWALLECRKPDIARTRTTSNNTLKIADYGLLGPSWRASRNAFGAPWGPLGRLGALLGRLGGCLPSPEATVGASGGRKSCRDSRRGPAVPRGPSGYPGGGNPGGCPGPGPGPPVLRHMIYVSSEIAT